MGERRMYTHEKLKIPTLDRMFEGVDVVNMDFPDGDISRRGTEKCSRIRGSVRIAMGKFRTKAEHQDWRRRKLIKPLP